MNIIRRIYLLLTLILLLISGCGGDEVTSDEVTLSDEFIFPSGTSGPLWEVSDAYIAELQNLDIPSDWAWIDIDEETRDKYYHSQLLKQFGDIAEVRYLIAYDLHPGDKTREQIVAQSEAQYRLFPNEETLKALQQTYTIPDPTKPGYSPDRAADEWMIEDPVGYMAHVEVNLLSRYGDIPEVHTYVRLELKRLLGNVLTDEEREERDAAAQHLINLDEQDEGRDN